MFLFPEPSKPTLTPRKYQIDAFEAVKVYLEYRTGNPCVVLPTGAGKTILIVLLCQWVCSWGGRVLILAHVKELLEQAADKLNQIAPELHVGVYSAGLDRKEKTGQVTIAGIQSIYKKASEFEPWDLVIGDECHLWPPEGDGMYRSFLTDLIASNENLRMVGLTATPYRLASGMLCGPDELLTNICYEIGVLDLINQGYLCPLTSKHVMDCDTKDLHIKAGEFNAEEVSILMSGDATVKATVSKIIERTSDRKSVLLFCASVDHAVKVKNSLISFQDVFSDKKDLVELITGETPSDERASILRRFKTSEIKYLVNVNVLTTGFDAPNVDCVCLLRPTLSAGLYYQMVGRGFRLSDGKPNCLILDFGSNIQRHGPVNSIRVEKKHSGKSASAPQTKICPACEEIVVANTRTCPSCEHEFPYEAQPVKHGYQPGSDNIIDDGSSLTEYEVFDVRYSSHAKKDAPPDHPKTLRVDYVTVKGGLIGYGARNSQISEWVCVEHDPGFALTKAKLWWQARSNDPFPRSSTRAADMGNGGSLAVPTKIWVAPDPKNPKYSRIVKMELGPKPEAIELCECQGEGCIKCEFDFKDVTSPDPTDFGDVPF